MGNAVEYYFNFCGSVIVRHARNTSSSIELKILCVHVSRRLGIHYWEIHIMNDNYTFKWFPNYGVLFFLSLFYELNRFFTFCPQELQIAFIFMHFRLSTFWTYNLSNLFTFLLIFYICHFVTQPFICLLLWFQYHIWSKSMKIKKSLKKGLPEISLGWTDNNLQNGILVHALIIIPIIFTTSIGKVHVLQDWRLDSCDHNPINRNCYWKTMKKEIQISLIESA